MFKKLAAALTAALITSLLPLSVYATGTEGGTQADPMQALSSEVATVYIGKGKKDKVSKGDIVGFLCKKGGMPLDMIGKIEVRERYAYVAVNRKKVADMLRKIQNEKIKGMKTVVELLK